MRTMANVTFKVKPFMSRRGAGETRRGNSRSKRIDHRGQDTIDVGQMRG